MDMYMCECMHEHMCVFMSEFVYMHVCTGTCVCMNSFMCVYTEEELSCCVLGERNQGKWSEERLVLGILQKAEIQVSWGQSLSPSPFDLRRKIGRSRYVLGCCAAWASDVLDFADTTFRAHSVLRPIGKGMTSETESASMAVVTQEAPSAA